MWFTRTQWRTYWGKLSLHVRLLEKRAGQASQWNKFHYWRWLGKVEREIWRHDQGSTLANGFDSINGFLKVPCRELCRSTSFRFGMPTLAVGWVSIQAPVCFQLSFHFPPFFVPANRTLEESLTTVVQAYALAGQWAPPQPAFQWSFGPFFPNLLTRSLAPKGTEVKNLVSIVSLIFLKDWYKFWRSK